MSPGMAALVLFGAFFVLIVLRVPVAFALGLACLPPLLFEERLSPMVLFNETFKAFNSFILLAVPFFLLTANLMNIGGITDRLVHLSRTMVGNWPGSLAQINVLLSVFFAGISGSSTADAASQSKIFIEAQTKEGYDLSFSIAITAVSAVLAVIIPPSILMIVWGGVLSVSIGALYLAGILPGLLIAGAQMATVHVYAKIYNYPVYPRATFREFVCSAAQSVPALMTPFIIVGGILLGWFTATESACVAVIYAAVLSIFVYRQMDGKQLYHALAETGRLSPSRCSASAPPRRSAGCSPITRFPARCWPTSPSGGWGSPRSVSSSPSYSWWWAASSTPSPRSSSSAPRSSRWRARWTCIPCSSPSSASCRSPSGW